MIEKLKPCRDIESGKFICNHGMYGTRLYHIWNGMKGRCFNKNNKDYPNYGGRGISICDEWKYSAEKFFEWSISHGYGKYLSIDRIDNNKGYTPENCQWISNKKQQRNKRNNHIVYFNGESHCVSEWADITGISKGTIVSRIRYGWNVKDILQVKPSHHNRLYRNSSKLESEG